MILIGASGHARVIIDILEKSGTPPDFLIDTDPLIKSILGYEVRLQNDNESYSDNQALISIGSNRIRKKVADRLSASFVSVVHPDAVLDPTSDLGKGTVVMAGVVINSSCHIGDHVIINTSASVDHDCYIDKFVHVSPGVTLCGNIRVGQGTHIGAGATVIPNLTIGKWCTIGAGAVIIKDIPDRAVVVGNPGRIIRYNE